MGADVVVQEEGCGDEDGSGGKDTGETAEGSNYAGQRWWHRGALFEGGVRDEDSFDGLRSIALHVIKLDGL